LQRNSPWIIDEVFDCRSWIETARHISQSALGELSIHGSRSNETIWFEWFQNQPQNSNSPFGFANKNIDKVLQRQMFSTGKTEFCTSTFFLLVVSLYLIESLSIIQQLQCGRLKVLFLDLAILSLGVLPGMMVSNFSLSIATNT
jgi:hypothetical protein